MEATKIIIGIDPDIDKSGFALAENGVLKVVGTSEFPQLIAFLQANAENIVNCYIEAGWLNQKANWHGGKDAIGQVIARKVGENHAIGKIIAQFCTEFKINHQLIKPTQSKLKQEQFTKITGWPSRTNQEGRDAAMLIYGRTK